MSRRPTSRRRRFRDRRTDWLHEACRPGTPFFHRDGDHAVKVVLLHTIDASEPPEDPVLGQIEQALQALGHTSKRLMVDDTVEPLVSALRADPPDLVFNMAEAFAGKSALESNVAALMNLLHLRYTGSSPAGLIVAGDKTLTKKVLSFHSLKTAKFATVYRGAVDWAGDITFPLIDRKSVVWGKT